MGKKRKAPLARMKDEHGDKEKLVDRLLPLIPLGGVDKETMKARLLAVSNRKLLRLLDVSLEIKDKHGSPAALAQATAAAAGKAKDLAYVAKLEKLALRAPARVLDLLAAAKRRGRAA